MDSRYSKYRVYVPLAGNVGRIKQSLAHAFSSDESFYAANSDCRMVAVRTFHDDALSRTRNDTSKFDQVLGRDRESATCASIGDRCSIKESCPRAKIEAGCSRIEAPWLARRECCRSQTQNFAWRTFHFNVIPFDSPICSWCHITHSRFLVSALFVKMDSSYRPQSPDLSSYAPRSPDLSGLQPSTSDLSGNLPSPRFGHQHSHSRDRFGGAFGSNQFGYGGSPTSAPPQPQYNSQPYPHDMPNTRRTKYDEDGEFLPDAPVKQSRRGQPNLPSLTASGLPFESQHSQLTAPLQAMSTQPNDPTLGVQLRTSFPVARIKRIMQADDDIGKVAQVTPHVVSRALELFMIKLISASAAQARGTSSGGSGKGPKRILAQHMKRAIAADDSYDFLADVIAKVPDAPVKGKKEAGSDSEDGGSGGGRPVKKRAKKRKDSGDDF